MTENCTKFVYEKMSSGVPEVLNKVFMRAGRRQKSSYGRSDLICIWAVSPLREKPFVKIDGLVLLVFFLFYVWKDCSLNGLQYAGEWRCEIWHSAWTNIILYPSNRSWTIRIRSFYKVAFSRKRYRNTRPIFVERDGCRGGRAVLRSDIFSWEWNTFVSFRLGLN